MTDPLSEVVKGLTYDLHKNVDDPKDQGADLEQVSLALLHLGDFVTSLKNNSKSPSACRLKPASTDLILLGISDYAQDVN